MDCCNCSISLDDRVVNHTALIFTGGQGVGKTTWLENLIPKSLKEYQFSGTINLANKDTTIHLAETMLINMDELENMNAYDIGKLKQVITQSVIRLRRPYAVYSENYIRRASFTGSNNSAQFLNDNTGSRRFLCFEVKDIHYMHNVDLNMVYSQALFLYRNGFKFYFDKKSSGLVTSQNDNFELVSPEEEYLLTYFEPVREDQATAFMNATMLLNHLEQKARTSFRKNANVSFGKILTKHKFVKTKENGLYVYALRKRALETPSLN